MNQHIKKSLTAAAITALFWFVFFHLPAYIFSLTLVGILVTILCTEWKKFFPASSLHFWLFMPLYPVLPFLLMIYLNQTAQYHELVYFLFVMVFSFDAGAYVTGTFLGRTLIAPTITPRKTVEGFIGGYLSALAAFSFSLYHKQIHLTAGSIFLFTFVVCCFAFLGDLFESFLKRRAQLKDSGAILPGHGGFLDRFDAVMFTVFFFYLLKDYLVLYLP
jgi:phosphatidate cytidylyltransferase